MPVPSASSAAPTLTFIVPVRDDAARLERCLASLRAARYDGPIRLLVVDNGSHDASPSVAHRAGAEVLTLPSLSVAQLRNQAAACVPDGILAFVDADHMIEAGWPAAAAESLARPGVGAVGMAYLAPPDATPVQRACDLFRSRPVGVVPVDWLGSGNLAVWKTTFEAINGFDTTLETCEDVDLCNRLRQGGFTLLSDDRLRSVHFGDPATLRALFFGELWRGRDNIRVTLRGPFAWRALPSLAIPISNLAALALFVAGVPIWPWGSMLLLLPAVAWPALTATIRALRMTGNDAGPAPWKRFWLNWRVAGVYEIARALALIVRASHRTRREGVRGTQA